MKRISIIVFFTAILLMPYRVQAHCDSVNGPVVKAAKLALEKGDITPVLKWVREEDEGAIRDAFRKTLLVRTKGKEAAELADIYFFETLVRIHRAGEGEPYTGLKSADQEVEPGIEAADHAIESGDLKGLMRNLHGRLEAELHARYARVAKSRKKADADVQSGRVFVADYVSFIHYVEGLFLAAQGGGHGMPVGNGESHQHQ
ncbi:MAG: DUF6448 family protein [Bacteroidota bacterium]